MDPFALPYALRQVPVDLQYQLHVVLQRPAPHAHKDLGPLCGIYFPGDALYGGRELALVLLRGGGPRPDLAGYTVAPVRCERQLSYAV